MAACEPTCLCVSTAAEEEGVAGRNTNYLSTCVQDGKLLVTCVGNDRRISRTAQITECLQGVRLQRVYRGAKWERRVCVGGVKVGWGQRS